MILLIDNYDSFTYNVYQYLGSINPDVKVIRNDKITVDEIINMKPEKIIISPGPGTPQDAGISIEIIKRLGKYIPILGICLGHQCIGEAFGATVSYAKNLFHGKYSMINLEDSVLFDGLQSPFKGARYHSLAIIENTMPDCLKVTARTEDGEIMAVEHTEYPVYGLQFHPESIYTPEGMKIIENFMNITTGGKTMIKAELNKIVAGNSLSDDEMIKVMDAIMSGMVSEIEISAFLTALKIKGETVGEITAAAKVMRDKAEKIYIDDYTLDTCGTGGDNSGTYNISTAVAFIAAAAGIKVAKHGNRSITSKCGSADVLEKLGVNIAITPEQTKECVDQCGIGFFFAPTFHKAMKHVMGVRRTLGFRTIFNILGPLSNPAEANGQVLGVFDEKLVEPMAEVLSSLGVERAMVVHGRDGLDELTTTDATFIAELKDGVIQTYEITPETYGIKRASIEDIKGGTAEENAESVTNLLSCMETGPKLDILLLNAGAALYIGRKANNIESGIKLAADIIASKKAYESIQCLAELTASMK
ncbi:MAG: bifunctional anthranilate synthase component II/anthranilate phosphoribosyltransferase [Clostridia bacterium]|nr:bifunctional anthranilate synthase component II/anthranilate phosphoribosyltransferase [Clostridia bacterium]